MVEVDLPFPPSVNHYWRHVGPRTLLSHGGRAYRDAVCAQLAGRQLPRLCSTLALLIEIAPPDRRRRDLDNTLKGLLDSAQHGGLYADDSQIDWLCVTRGPVLAGGRARLRVQPLEQDAERFEQHILESLRSRLAAPRT